MKKHVHRIGIVALIVVVFLGIHQASAYIPPNAAVPTDYNGSPLHDGDLISFGATYGDPDIFIIKLLTNNADLRSPDVNGYKRLFLNPAIFSMYAHLGGFSNVRRVTNTVRDSFETTGLFRNCETGDQAVYATEITGEDSGILHHVQITGEQANSEDRYFFSKVFCINNREQAFYPISTTPYMRLSEIPRYDRTPNPTPTISPIVTGNVELQSPNGGEQFQQGSTIIFTWTSSGFDSDAWTQISLYESSNPRRFATIVTQSTPNTGTFTWTVPTTLHPGTYGVSMAMGGGDQSNGTGVLGQDYGDAPFTISEDQSQTVQSRNSQRWQDVNTILNSIGQRLADNHGQWSTQCLDAFVDIPTATSNIGRSSVDVESCIVPSYTSNMRIDPLAGSYDSTGYTVRRDTSWHVTVSAPYAELGEVISVTR